ncbi:chaperone protein dnaJ 8, chloroplastic-like [Lotus japonicus]|uniref:J domain-containing protein n=1 Tax=Lotus japonicus TaxID=34305 RepID=I3T8G8_LOTJA|nr:chaperone protein dnaJ 8, chloroplastic-like [Lotus japonicus]AFK48810.1 unknown [Lotus japonicus]
MAAAAAGVIGGYSLSWMQFKGRERNHNRVMICCSSSLMDSYKTLRVQPGASQTEVKKAFRHLALQYHPDVCQGSKCGVQFHHINEAYDVVMANLRGESNTSLMYEAGIDEAIKGVNDQDLEDLWEEWMGWEGAGIRDYSSHINPYI